MTNNWGNYIWLGVYGCLYDLDYCNLAHITKVKNCVLMLRRSRYDQCSDLNGGHNICIFLSLVLYRVNLKKSRLKIWKVDNYLDSIGKIKIILAATINFYQCSDKNEHKILSSIHLCMHWWVKENIKMNIW